MKKRLQQLIDYLHTNVSQFEKNISVSNGAIRNAMLRDKGLNSDVISKILDIYPTINPDWLLLGRGEMLRKNVHENTSSMPADKTMCEKIIAELRSELAAAYRTIGQLEYQLQHEGEKTNSTSAQMATELTSV